jgi:hypothetical protein
MGGQDDALARSARLASSVAHSAFRPEGASSVAGPGVRAVSPLGQLADALRRTQGPGQERQQGRGRRQGQRQGRGRGQEEGAQPDCSMGWRWRQRRIANTRAPKPSRTTSASSTPPTTGSPPRPHGGPPRLRLPRLRQPIGSPPGGQGWVRSGPPRPSCRGGQTGSRLGGPERYQHSQGLSATNNPNRSVEQGRWSFDGRFPREAPRRELGS